jgi:hypothetical protein
MVAAASTPETSVNCYHTTRRTNPEENRPHIRCRENLKYQTFWSFYLDTLIIYVLTKKKGRLCAHTKVLSELLF